MSTERSYGDHYGKNDYIGALKNERSMVDTLIGAEGENRIITEKSNTIFRVFFRVAIRFFIEF